MLNANVSSWRGAHAVLCGPTIVWIWLLRRGLPDEVADGGRLHADEILVAYRPLLAIPAMTSLNGSTIARVITWAGMLTYFECVTSLSS